jgi:phosphotriesterase-related protein
VLSHDASCYFDWADPTLLPLVLPNWHYRHIHEAVLPALRERGVTEEQIATMLVANPRRFFEG